MSDDWTFKLSFKGTSRQDWVPVDKQKFDDALCDLDKPDPNNPNGKKGDYQINFKATANATGTPYQPPCRVGSIKTEKITRSAIADNASGDASAANDPNATQHVRVQRAQDLDAVLAAFVEPSPTPTPGPSQ